jgi:SAM-dependent methyltransferase
VTEQKDSWNKRYTEAGFLWGVDPNRFLVSECEAMPPGRALDLACGEGRNAVWLAGKGWQVTGVDFSDAALDKARQLAQTQEVGVEWVLADLTDYAPASSAFDLVIIFYLQLAESAHRLILQNAQAALRESGTLLVVGHDLTNLTDGHGGPQDPARLFTPDDVVACVPELRIERAERVRRPVSVDGQTVYAIDALVRAVR